MRCGSWVCHPGFTSPSGPPGSNYESTSLCPRPLEGTLVEFVDTNSKDRTMWHTVFIVLHAASGVVAFGTGCVAVRRQPLFPYYFWSLALLDIFMVISVAVGWRDMSTTSRVV